MMTDTARLLAKRSELARDAILVRDQLVRQMRGEGASLRAIAEAAGLSAAGVAKILKRPVSLDATGARR